MPAAPTHIQFAEDCLSRRSSAGLPALNPDLAGAVMAGTQGSDPFYIFGRIPWRRRARTAQVQAFADFIHGRAPAYLFPPLAARAAEASGDDKALLGAYLYGFLLHYILDRTMHPYVYFRTGFNAEGEPTGIYSKDHMRYETALASLLVSRRAAGGKEVWQGPVADAASLELIGSLYAEALPGRVEPGDFSLAWKDFVMARRLARDPWGLKGTLLDLLGVKSIFRAMMRPDRPSIGDRIDYANDTHAVWLRPGDGVPSVASVQDLWGDALKSADRLGAFLERAMQGGAERQDWEAAFGDLDHEGRHPGEKMRFFRSAYRPRDQRLP